MTTALVLEPHNDDAALFSAFNAIRTRAHIVTVLASSVERTAESAAAAAIFGCSYEQWPEPDDAPDWKAVARMLLVHDSDHAPEIVFAPWPESSGGNEQHNMVGRLAEQVYGDRVTFYTTYRTGAPRTTGTPVPYEREWVLMKLRALACFESQIRSGPVRFFAEHSLLEWTRP